MNTFLLLLPCEIMKTQWRFPLSLLFSSRVVPVLILELFSNYNYQGVSFNLLHLFPIPWWHYSTLSKLWSQIKNKWQIKRLFPLYCLPCWCWYKLEGPKKVFIEKNMLTSSKRPSKVRKCRSKNMWLAKMMSDKMRRV